MLNSVVKFAVVLLVPVLFLSCKDDVLPKPKSHLRLDYPAPKYELFNTACPYAFNYNSLGVIKHEGDCNYRIEYPLMKATVYLNYKKVDNNIEALLKDAQKLTYGHVVKADEIISQPFLNPDQKVYGMFYEVGGNAASPTQFYATDSTRNFVLGSVYFYAKPNFDSIFPAADYIRHDVKNLMETLRWK